MSGPFGSSQWMYSSGGFYPTEIEQSLRFNDDDSAYLSRTPASAGNRKTWTWSGWVKPCNINVEQNLFSVRSGTSYPHLLVYMQDVNSGGKFRIIEQSSSSTYINVEASPYLRDPSAWYHLVLAVDTTQATASDRVKLYINGVQPSMSLTTYPAQNQDTMVNSTTAHAIGRRTTNAGANIYSDKYLAETHFIDGQALDPTDFGEFKSGVWVAKEYTGSYGTNGFYLNFSDSSAIGDDLSGNSNDWTANNLVATDVVLDSPTNNFCTLNPVDKRSGSNVDEANLFIGPVSGNHYWARGTIKIPNDQKIYLEALAGDNGSGSIVAFFGIIEENSNLDSGAMDNGVACNSADFYKHVDGSGSTQGSSVLTAGDIVGLAFDMPASTMTIYKNGSVTTNAVSFTPGEFYLYLSIFFNYGGTPSWVLNAGQDSSFNGRKTRQGNTDDNGYGDFYYAPPSGYLALCTANLPDPAIDPAKDDVPADYFNTVLYTGDGTAGRTVSGVGFQADLIWIKNRSSASFTHQILDAVRGKLSGANSYARLRSDTTAAEATPGGDDGLTDITSDGFTVDADESYNNSGNSFVAWNWLAGNGTSSNSDGSITSTVSVNEKAGFSITSWTGTGASSATVGHGLGATPKVVIIKDRDTTNNWYFAHTLVDGSNDVLYLNLTDANGTLSGATPTSTVFTVEGGRNASGNNQIAYCFAEVEGYSKFGSYTGNGSTDGPMLYLGFEPAFFLAKRTDGVENWFMIDNARHPYNDGNIPRLLPNLSNAEAEDASIAGDFLSNGFKIRATQNMINTSGANYIYMAFAENPFKYANAR